MSDAILFPIVAAGLILWVAIFVAEVIYIAYKRRAQ